MTIGMIFYNLQIFKTGIIIYHIDEQTQRLIIENINDQNNNQPIKHDSSGKTNAEIGNRKASERATIKSNENDSYGMWVSNYLRKYALA